MSILPVLHNEDSCVRASRVRTAARAWLSAIAIVLLMGSVSPTAWAQDSAEPPIGESGPPPPEPLPPEVIPVSEIAQRATDAITELHRIRENLGVDPKVQAIDDELDQIAQHIETQDAQSESQIPEEQYLRSLEEVQQQWLRHKDQLDQWAETLDGRSEGLAKNGEEVALARGLWQRTAEFIETQEVPPAVTERAETVLSELDATEAELRERTDAVLTLDTKVSEYELVVIGALSRINAAKEQRLNRVFVFEDPPIWRAPIDVDIATHLRMARERVRSGVQEFFRTYRESFFFQVACFILLALLMRVLVRRAGAQEQTDDSLAAAYRILSRPIPAAFLIAILPWGLLYPNAPIVVREIMGITLAVALLLLIPAYVPPRYRPIFGFFIAMFFVSNVQFLFGPHTLFRRVTALIVSVTAMGVLSVMARRIRLDEDFGRARHNVVMAVVWLAIAGYTIASVWNVLGGTDLSELVSEATTNIVLIFVILWGSVYIVQALNTLLLRSRVLQSSSAIKNHQAGLEQNSLRFLSVGAGIWWTWIVLREFRASEAAAGALEAIFNATASVGKLSISLGGIVAFVLTLVVTFAISRTVRTLLQDDILPRTNLPRGVPGSIAMLVNYAIVALGFIVALTAAGIRMEQFALLVGALGVGLGFGLQNIVNNFISGLILIFERPIQVGDTIEVGQGQLTGRVRHIGIRASTVRTFDGAEVLIPNGDLISSQVVNWTLSDRLRRLEVKIGVAYGTDPQRVLDLLLEAAKTHERVLKYPEPAALFLGFGESSLDFAMRFWTADFENFLAVRSEVSVDVNTAIKAAGITIPFPQRDLHIKEGGENVDQAVAWKSLQAQAGGSTASQETPAAKPESPSRGSMPDGESILDDGDDADAE